MAKYYKKKAKEGRITIGEFKAYISAIEDMFGDDWTPTPEQWKKIRTKITLVDDTVEEVVRESADRTRVGAPMQAMEDLDDNEAAIMSSFPRGGGGVPANATVVPGSALSVPAQGALPPVPPTPLRPNNPLLSTGAQVKTPDVVGPYETPFV